MPSANDVRLTGFSQFEGFFEVCPQVCEEGNRSGRLAVVTICLRAWQMIRLRSQSMCRHSRESTSDGQRRPPMRERAMIVRHVGLATDSNRSNVSRSINCWRMLTFAVGIFTSANGFSSINLCFRATCRNVRAKDKRLASVAGASFWVSSHSLNCSQSPDVMFRKGLSSPKNWMRFRQGCCQTSSVAGLTSSRFR